MRHVHASVCVCVRVCMCVSNRQEIGQAHLTCMLQVKEDTSIEWRPSYAGRQPLTESHPWHLPTLSKLAPTLLQTRTHPTLNFHSPYSKLAPTLPLPPYLPPLSPYIPLLSPYLPPLSPYLPLLSPYLPPLSPYLPPLSPYIPLLSPYIPPLSPYLPPLSPYLPLLSLYLSLSPYRPIVTFRPQETCFVRSFVRTSVNDMRKNCQNISHR